jgi:hypothetical protein
MSGQNDIVQRLATGRLTSEEKRGYSEDNSKYGTENPEPKEPRKISFALNQEEKLAIYQDVKLRVIDGATPDEIGKAVVACMNQYLEEKENEAYGSANPNLKGDKKKGGFRRVD